ncbi:MAG: methyltransferase domain-containing protein [Flavobacteriaceae bacterium]|nr:methyltransferase domain-containing protein [Flavobacteriaceae bacterium]
MKNLTQSYWNNRWKTGQTGWDIGYASPAIVHYFEGIKNKNAKILIPGCGNAYEAEALYNLGFNAITILDISDEAVIRLNEKFDDYPEIRIICQNFFDHSDSYDLIVEQTFFCALDPSLRKAYAEKMHQLLRTNGKLVGLLFNRDFENEGPPFGGNKAEYEELFAPLFEIKKLEIAQNSIPQRQKNEVFIEFIKK